MKEIRKNINITLIAFLILLFFTGCDQDSILNKTSPVQQDPESFYSSKEGATSAINSAYASLQSSGLYNEEYIDVVGASTDDWFLNNTWGTTLNSWSFTPEEAAGDRIDVVWQTLYEGGFRSNLVLQRVPDSDMDKSIKDRILGEAHFLRGYFYWHLTKLFGEIPIVMEANPNDPTTGEIEKSPINEVYNFIINEMKKASAMLPKKSEYPPSETGRAPKGAAQTILGKVYLYQQDYTMAETYFDSVIASGEYRLLKNYNDVYITDNNDESIFELQYEAPDESRSTFGWPNGHGGPGNYVPTQDAVDAFEEYRGTSSINDHDPRLFYSIFQQGEAWHPPETPVYQEKWAPSPGYTIKKRKYPVPDDYLTQGPSRNLILLRLADVILVDSEAALMNGKPEKAVRLINDVRERVGMPIYDVANMSKQQILDAIVHERRVELMFEYQRLFDLQRWGLAEKYLGPLGYELPKNRYFPIPSEEVQANPNLEQNPNY